MQAMPSPKQGIVARLVQQQIKVLEDEKRQRNERAQSLREQLAACEKGISEIDAELEELRAYKTA